MPEDNLLLRMLNKNADNKLQLNALRQKNDEFDKNQYSLLGDMKEWWNGPKTVTGEKTTQYPAGEDVELSNKYDTTYGNPVAGFTKAGNASIRSLPIQNVPSLFNDNRVIGGKTAPVTELQAEQIHKAWIAAQRSPTAALGFDPHSFVTSDPTKRQLTIAGAYRGKDDTLWFDPNHSDAAVHESIHRGLKKLRDNNLFPKAAADIPEEYIVRGLMVKYLGDIEMKSGEAGKAQAEIGKMYLQSRPDIFSAVEKASQQLYGQLYSKGPH